MIWIQVRTSDNLVVRCGDTQRSPRAGTLDYGVNELPAYVTGDAIYYDGTSFSIDSTARIAAEKSELEPLVLTAYRAWQDAIAIGLDCVDMCQAKYEALKAQLDDLS